MIRILKILSKSDSSPFLYSSLPTLTLILCYLTLHLSAMRFLVVAAAVAGALASVIPKSDVNEATHLLEVDADATDAIAFAGVQYSSVVFWEKAQ